MYKSEVSLSFQNYMAILQKLPDEPAELKDIVGTLTKAVTSESSLEKIIAEEDLYVDIREISPMDAVVETMRKDINVVQSGKDNTFVVEYKGSDPEKVARVTEVLGARFIEESLQYLQKRALEISARTENELDTAKAMLDKKEVEMHDYKLKYYNEMPAQLAENKSRLALVRAQYEKKQKSLQDLERSRLMIQNKIDVTNQKREENRKKTNQQLTGGPETSTVITIDQESQLEMLKSGLLALQNRYSDQHPQVKGLKNQIDNLEKLINEQAKQSAHDSAAENRENQYESELADLDNQLKGINAAIGKLDREQEEIQALIERYNEWIASAPVREAEWLSLTREYAELKQRYDGLVAQNFQSSASSPLEIGQEGGAIIQAASVGLPETPIKHGIIGVTLLSVVGGLLLGGSLALGLDVIDTSVKSPVELEQTFDLPLICSVPGLPLAAEAVKKRFWFVVRIIFFLIWFGVLCAALVQLGM